MYLFSSLSYPAGFCFGFLFCHVLLLQSDSECVRPQSPHSPLVSSLQTCPADDRSDLSRPATGLCRPIPFEDCKNVHPSFASPSSVLLALAACQCVVVPMFSVSRRRGPWNAAYSPRGGLVKPFISGERGECWLIKKQSVIPKYFLI